MDDNVHRQLKSRLKFASLEHRLSAYCKDIGKMNQALPQEKLLQSQNDGQILLSCLQVLLKAADLKAAQRLEKMNMIHQRIFEHACIILPLETADVNE